jgi:prephenate dehydrogenase
MCGKEVSGLEAADAGLFAGACYILTPLPRTSDEALGLGCELAEAVGARPLLLDAPRHDRLAAVASHLPYMAAIGLTTAAQDLNDETVWEVAASGFRDTSRLAASDVTMMVDILLTNAREVSNAVIRYQTQLLSLAQTLEKGDEDGLRALLDTAARQRRVLFQ